MDTVARFREQLDTLEFKFAQFRREWEQHLSQIREREQRIETDYPTKLTPNAWATQQTLSEALQRLSAIEDSLPTRWAALADLDLQSDSNRSSLQNRICRALSRTRVASETLAWQYISAIVEVQEGFTVETQVLQRVERIRTAEIHCVVEAYNKFADIVRSHRFVTLCKFQTVNEKLERELSERSDIHVNDRKILETELEERRKLLRNCHSPEWVIMRIQAMFARFGISMARQTLITEYFKSERIDDSENGDSEDEESEEEDNEDDDIEDGNGTVEYDGRDGSENEKGDHTMGDDEPVNSGMEKLEECRDAYLATSPMVSFAQVTRQRSITEYFEPPRIQSD